MKKLKKLEDLFTSEEEIEGQYLFCYDDYVDISDVADELEADLGIKLKSKGAGSVVNGALIALNTLKGNETWCGNKVDNKHTCIILFLYKKSKITKEVKIETKKVTKVFEKAFNDSLKNKGFKLREQNLMRYN